MECMNGEARTRSQNNDTDTCHMCRIRHDRHLLKGTHATHTGRHTHTQKHTSTRAVACKRTTAAAVAATASRGRSRAKERAQQHMLLPAKVRKWKENASRQAARQTGSPNTGQRSRQFVCCCYCCSLAVHFVLAFGLLCVHTHTHTHYTFGNMCTARPARQDVAVIGQDRQQQQRMKM